MKIVTTALTFVVVTPFRWSADWAWGLPLIVFTVVIHVYGLLLISHNVERVEKHVGVRYTYPVGFMVIIGGVALLATILHGIEGAIWAVAYRLVGALPDYGSAILYSLSAMTSYGHANLDLEEHWQLLGALEALNGMLLFGLTTAFLFGVIQRAWGVRSSRLR